jgi:HD-GYP domain-containing protein (c-di-GMP phosphodiesterase class II)
MQYLAYADTKRYTIAHSVRVAALVLQVGVSLKLPQEDLLAAGSAALLRDIGMSRIPWPILEQEEPLSEEEWKLIFDHPRCGLEILMAQTGISECDLAGCWGHYQRFDGGGYPPLPGWAEHHPVATLLHVCDVFEALTSPRPYQRLLTTPKDAYRLMQDDQCNCDPNLLAALIASLGLYPPVSCPTERQTPGGGHGRGSCHRSASTPYYFHRLWRAALCPRTI